MREGEEDYLTEEQQNQVDEAIRQADAGEFVTEEEYLKATGRWRARKKRVRLFGFFYQSNNYSI